MYIITPEKKSAYLVGTLLNNPCYIYKIETSIDLGRFVDGVVCYDVESLFEVIEKVLQNEKSGRIQRRVRGHSFGSSLL